MTSQEPQLLFQGINYLGLLSKQLADLHGMSTLAHELIQNADDAKDESGKLSATRMTFDVRDDALVVSNDGVFRKIDFKRMQDVAGGSKRSEPGERTTGAFGVGFISVYQITDRPQLRSAGRQWVLRPDEEENRRIAHYDDPSMTEDKGTVFRLPWAFDDSRVRRALKVQTVDRNAIQSFVDDLKESLPQALLFLKKIAIIDLYQNGKRLIRVERSSENSTRVISLNGKQRRYRIIEGDFKSEAMVLRERYPSIEKNRSCVVQIAVPDSTVDDGLLFATLPTEQRAGLPFHINADFFPVSDRRSIAFENEYDYRSEWNRAAIRAAACAIRDKLDTMRKAFQDRPTHFWSIVQQVQRVHYEYREDRRRPFSQFWELLLPALRCAPVVYVTYAQWHKWLVPSSVRIPTGRSEESAAQAFRALGIDVVNPDHYSYRNILTHVGVRTLSVSDIYGGLRARGFVGAPRPYPTAHEEEEFLKLLWIGCYAVIRNTRQESSRRADRERIGSCVLAPGLDGRVWPCSAAYQADDKTQRVFANIIPHDRTFLHVGDVTFLRELCPKFTLKTAIEWIERIPEQRLQKAWTSGRFYPAALLEWFDLHKVELTPDLCGRLSRLPICPTAGRLHAIHDLYIPGGFEDPVGIAKLADTTEIAGLSDFLRFLGIRELSFVDYARSFITQVFASDSHIPAHVKRDLLAIMDLRLRDLMIHSDIKPILTQVNIVECTDGRFRKPQDAYFPSKELVHLFGGNTPVVRVPSKNVCRQDLYRWLGVASRPRPRDVIAFIRDTVKRRPSHSARSAIRRVFPSLSQAVANSNDVGEGPYSLLKRMAWLPAEGDYSTWWKPSQLSATHFKHLFESQAKFIDIPQRQQRSEVLRYLDVKRSPEPYQVARHLLECARRGIEPPRGIYRWLNEYTESGHLSILKGEACLRADGRYLRPEQVFWAQHPFGRFRYQLGSDLLRYHNLLSSLDIKHIPDHNDAIEVLKEIGAEKLEVNRRLSVEDESIVGQCWMIIADALHGGRTSGDWIRSELINTLCIPCPRPESQRTLEKPSLVFFNDRPGYKGTFEVIKWNLIDRPQGVWRTMESAGVRSLSKVVKESISELRGARSDTELKARLDHRSVLIGAVLESVLSDNPLPEWRAQIDGLKFEACDAVIVLQQLNLFGGHEQMPTSVSAYLNSSESTIYFATLNGRRPWSAIARELTQAIAPGDEAKALAPTLMTVLEAHTRDDAINQLSDFDISVPAELTAEAVVGDVVKDLEESPSQNGASESSPESNQAATSPFFDEVEGEQSEADSLDGNGVIVHSTNVNQDPPGTDDPLPSIAQAHPRVPFAKLFYGVQERDPRVASDSPAILAEGGPQTAGSARIDTEQSGQVGRQGSRVERLRVRWEPTRASADLERKFRNMTQSDYVERCQICGNTFKKRAGGDRQIFVVHVVKPSSDDRTNHYGNLLGLCGWHYALMQYGVFEYLNPDTAQPFEDSETVSEWEHMQEYILSVSEKDYKEDKLGNRYVGLPVKFWNVYKKWSGEPDAIPREIRYCLPHWFYLCELLQT